MICLHIWMHIECNMNTYEYIWIHMNTYEYIWIRMNTYEYVWTHMNKCTYIHICIYCNIYIYTYIHTHNYTQHKINMSLHAAPLSQLPTNFCAHQVLRHFRRGHRGDVLSQGAKAQGSIENTQTYHEIIGDHMRSCEIMWDHLTSTLRSSDSKLDDKMRGLHCVTLCKTWRTSNPSDTSLANFVNQPWQEMHIPMKLLRLPVWISQWQYQQLSQHEPTSADFSQKPWFLSSVLLKKTFDASC